jgi:uncharacterized protein YjgD (DUF1641 family)
MTRQELIEWVDSLPTQTLTDELKDEFIDNIIETMDDEFDDYHAIIRQQTLVDVQNAIENL